MRALKRAPALLIAVAVACTVMATPVHALTITERKSLAAMVNSVTSTMKLILENYVGSEVTAAQLYEGAMRGMMETLDDYSNYYDADELSRYLEVVTGKYFGVGVTISTDSGEAVIVDVMRGGPAEKAGVLPGDVILGINGADAADVGLEALLELFGDESTPDINLLLSRGGETLPFTLAKEVLSQDSVFIRDISSILPQAAPVDDERIGYIYISSIMPNTAEDFRAAVRELQDRRAKRLILDLRGNPGGILDVTLDLCRSIVPAGPIITVTNKTGGRQMFSSELKTPPFEKFVIITDENTASGAEVIASAMQDAGAAAIVGQTTFGKGVGQTNYDAEGGGAIYMTVFEFFSRNGRKINNAGVTPDVVVPMPSYLYADGVSLDESGCSPLMNDVKRALAYLGYPAGEDGAYYDETTRASMAAFQKDHALKNDGVIGYETIVGLNKALYESKNDPALEKAYEIAAQ